MFPSVFSGCSPVHDQMPNLRSIDVAVYDDYTAVSLNFVNGSYGAGYNEYTLDGIPEYSISMTEQPERLKIEIKGLSFWDGVKAVNIDETGIVSGVFGEAPEGSGTYAFYIQLAEPARYNVEKRAGALNIVLTPEAGYEGVKYYCLSDSFEARREGLWPRELQMTPVLCSDLKNKLIISQPFDTQAQADAFMKKANILLETMLPGAKVYVDTLYGNSLPDYVYDSYAFTQTRSMVSVSGEVQNTPVLLRNGRYLSTGSDGRILFSKISYNSGDGVLTDSETLWILEQGTTRKLAIKRFEAIQQAVFSPDGRYISVLDSSEGGALYIYDSIENKIYDMADEGLGAGTQSFSWSDTSEVIYAVTGDEESKLISCAFLPDGTLNIVTLRSLTSSYGEVCVSKGRVFYSEGDFDTGGIYEYGEPDRVLTRGYDFIISHDGRYLLVLEISSAEDAGLTSLKLYDIQTGISQYVARGADIDAYCLLPDGSGVIYTVYAGNDEDYPYELYEYDISADAIRLAALSATGDIYSGGAQREVYLVYGPDDENGIYSTYIYDIK